MVNPIYQQGEELMLNPFGSKYLGVAAHTNVNSNEFIVQEDAVISVLTGGDSSIAANDVDYKASMSLSGVTLKQGALIVAPQGESFQSMTIDSGTIMAYNSVVGGTKPSAAPLLLDLYPDAAAAYSLRKLRNDYTGDAIEVRRTVGTPSNTDIGFVNGELDTSSLLSFVGSGDGFVSKWYDQSGEGNDIPQFSASAQPKIVTAGVVELDDNGNNTMLFSGGQYFDGGTSILNMNSTELMFFSIAKSTNTNGSIFAKALFANAANRYGHAISSGIFYSTLTSDANAGRTASTSAAINVNRLNASVYSKTASNHKLYFNEVLQATKATSASDVFNPSAFNFYVGAYGAGIPSLQLNGTISSVILYIKDGVDDFDNIQTKLMEDYNL